MTLEQEWCQSTLYTDGQTPANGPLIEAMNDDDDVAWGGRGNMRWKHRTRGCSFIDVKTK